MTFDFLFNTIGVNPPDRCFEQFFHEAVSEYQDDGVFFLSDQHIDYVNSFTGCLSNCLDELKRAAQNLHSLELQYRRYCGIH